MHQALFVQLYNPVQLLSCTTLVICLNLWLLLLLFCSAPNLTNNTKQLNSLHVVLNIFVLSPVNRFAIVHLGYSNRTDNIDLSVLLLLD